MTGNYTNKKHQLEQSQNKNNFIVEYFMFITTDNNFFKKTAHAYFERPYFFLSFLAGKLNTFKRC